MESALYTCLESVRKICPKVSEPALAEFASRLRVNELDKKEHFLKAGQEQRHIGFIARGLTRSYFNDQKENEVTVGFYSEGSYATHYPSFIAQTPSRYSIQCLEPTSMVCLSYEDMQFMYEHFPVFQAYGRLIAEGILKAQQNRIESFIFQTAEERYLDFIQYHPTLFNRISLSHLCSYLGVERQSLTRIRHKLAHK